MCIRFALHAQQVRRFCHSSGRRANGSRVAGHSGIGDKKRVVGTYPVGISKSAWSESAVIKPTHLCSTYSFRTQAFSLCHWRRGSSTNQLEEVISAAESFTVRNELKFRSDTYGACLGATRFRKIRTFVKNCFSRRSRRYQRSNRKNETPGIEEIM